MQNPQVIELKGQRVLTTRQLASAYETDVKVIQNNFSRNKERYVAGKHYIYMDRDELREVKTTYPQFEGELKRTSRAHFWTEKGALLHAKSLNTDKAWEVYEYLVDFYFRAKEQVAESVDKLEERKLSTRMVVDAPENIKIQQAMQEVRDRMTTINVMLDEANDYCSEEKYKKSIGNISDLWLSLGRKMVGLENIEPNIIEKKC